MIDWKARAPTRARTQARLLWWAEFALLALLAVQCARLVYAAVTAPGPVGRWTAAPPTPVTPAWPAGFDPFAGGTPSPGPVAATTLDLVLAGVRLDRATGRGSAILGRPGQPQLVYQVGDEVAPGVRLASVAFDHVDLDQGGTRTQLFMDQSIAAAPAAPPTVPPTVPNAAPAPPPALPATAQTLAREVEATPRVEGGTVTGYALGPVGEGTRFRALGLQPGDVLVAVDGRPVAQLGAQDLGGIDASGAELQVERGGQRVTVRARP